MRTSSLGSDEPSPGLTDDRTDSEVSQDDDYQYHSHTSELWNKFWQAELEAQMGDILETNEKKYPALISSPEKIKKISEPPTFRPVAWPLHDRKPEPERKQQDTYSVFPKPMSIPPLPCLNRTAKPQRPPRPDNVLLEPCVQGRAKPPVALTIFPDRKLKGQPSPPLSPTTTQRPATSHGPLTRKKTLIRVPSIPSDLARTLTRSKASRSTTHIPMPEAHRHKAEVPRTSKSAVHLATMKPPPVPLSAFDLDDSDSDDEHHSLSFFRFARRGDNERRPSKASQSIESNAQRRQRERSCTAPSSPTKHKQDAQHKQTSFPPRRQSDVLSRMLGRRNR